MFRAMEFLPAPFVGCKDTWEVVYANPAAKAAFNLQPNEPASLTKFLSAEVLSTLKSSTENSVRVVSTAGSKGELYAVRFTKLAKPEVDTGAVYFVALQSVPNTVIPPVFESTFNPENTLSTKLSLTDVNFKGLRVVIRVDFNVPMNKDGKITNDFRVRSTLPTIQKVLSDGAKTVVLMSHLGRPKEKGFEEKYSLKAVAAHLQTLLPNTKVHFAPDCMHADEVIAASGPGDVVLLENLRFYPEEASKDAARRMVMAKKLASYGSIYINDAFGTAHRKAASVTDVPRCMGLGVAGALLNQEISSFQVVLQEPKRPMLAIIGGAKVTDKIKVLRHLCGIVDYLIIGGAMSYPFLKAQGISIGASFIEKDKKTGEDVTPVAKGLLEYAASKTKVRILLPSDHMVTDAFKDVPGTPTTDSNVPADKMSLDIGPVTIKKYEDLIATCRTIIWNGPVGVFEMKNYSRGTFAIAKAIAKVTTESGAISVAGGGDTVSAVEKAGVQKKFSHVSTGGGATLELLEGKALPGLVYLTNKVSPKL